MKIYDCFSFFNELELLELRLNILDPVVDHFVLCEADTTHSGLPKPFYFEENKERFARFLPKLIHVKVSDMPQQFDSPMLFPACLPANFDEECLRDIWRFIADTGLFNKTTEKYYGRDFFQKECVRRGLYNCNDDDVIISSDLDEIPNPEILKRLESYFFDRNKFFTFEQKSYYYYLNMLQQPDWHGSRMGTFGMLKHYSYNELRKQLNIIIPNGGWHFSFQGGAERVIKKIESYSHQELNTEEIKQGIAEKIKQGIDPYNRGSLIKVAIDDTFPRYLLDNIDTYKHMIAE